MNAWNASKTQLTNKSSLSEALIRDYTLRKGRTHMKRLQDEELIETYREAFKVDAPEEFLQLLREEFLRRFLEIPSAE
ncbi:sporulation histidine kinase inhibitor Sda [Paenibacillus sp. GD4]|uniref:sporulation histidine kinase inhibitor Sda n=1 Tax=Paenibacillus sp. GD4 TaxID=3068890 RepID=UPI00279695ED|nr:sporulation histidine kinase inhibitor Sda [Paenibacillus sp. GD4]MDQ1913277.1 sporulation histidine kinase inhibitor Sda [Paenibacillus sp. GD4]